MYPWQFGSDFLFVLSQHFPKYFFLFSIFLPLSRLLFLSLALRCVPVYFFLNCAVLAIRLLDFRTTLKCNLNKLRIIWDVPRYQVNLCCVSVWPSKQIMQRRTHTNLLILSAISLYKNICHWCHYRRCVALFLSLYLSRSIHSHFLS